MGRDMVQYKSNHIALAEFFCSRETIHPLAGIALQVAYKIVVWSNRLNTRKALAKLDKTRLDDIGVNEVQAKAELCKPFWRA